MRRTVVLAAAALALGASAGIAQADVTDVLVVPSVGGVLSLAGTGMGTVGAPLTAASATIGGAATSATGAVLTVTDARGLTGGSSQWSVTASYAPLLSGALSSITVPSGLVGTADIGGANVSVTPAVPAPLALTNSALGATPTLLGGSLSSAVKVASVASGSAGVTAFNTSYSISLPVKSVANTLYTGSVVYTVASTP